jgi:PAS domain S-box-containing protein
MNAHDLASTKLVDGLSAKQLLEGLGRVYRWIIVTDSRRRIVWMSEGVSSLFGSETLAVGADARNFLPKLPRPEQIFSLRAELRNRSHLANVPLELPTRDGRRLPVEVSLLKVDTVEPGGHLLIAVARSLESGPPLSQGDGPERALVEAAPDAILVLDSDGFVVFANEAAGRLTGRDSATLVGDPAALLFGESAVDVERIASAVGLPDGGECRVTLRRADGAQLPVAVTVSAFESSPGGEECRALFLRDVSERDRVEADLRRTNEELEHCVTSLAHDLRSPLVALLGFSRLLRQEYETLLDQTGRHFIDRIEQAGRTMESLVHDLLELSRIGRSGEHLAMVDPRGVLAQLKGELKPRLDERGIELKLQESAPPLVLSDRTRLYQLLSNLIGNALDHMGEPESPRIEVTVRDEEEGHHIVVRDNGRGIAPDQIPRIFEPFHSVSREGRRGTGMGLAIVKRIAETRGGRVWVESAPGEGASFHVILPSS